MELIDQHSKQIMEECKRRARACGLSFGSETLEYIVSNRDLLELTPKFMIPTLYDYWVHDVEVLKEYGKYKLYPTNPYETVINSRPAISFYNSDNPDWLNIMIFYHVLAHIDFFQNNIFFEHTWGEDFVGVALADKRLIENYRRKYGRWVDYVIEFARSIDNIVGNFDLIFKQSFPQSAPSPLIFYFDVFLQEIEKVPINAIFAEIGKYNHYIETLGNQVGESTFFTEVRTKYPEFDATYEKYKNSIQTEAVDLLEFIRDNSPFLKQESNQWMKTILTIIRNTALYFAPQVRTKIMNEGWASYWHDTLFRTDERISSHEVDYARVNALVTSISRVGLNPYAIGLRLFQFIEEQAEKGKFNNHYQQIEDIQEREDYNLATGEGKDYIFNVRKYFSDFTFINTFVNQEFVDKFNLFVVGMNYDPRRQVIQYYVQSRRAEDYKKMLLNALYHPPFIRVNKQLTNKTNLYLIHEFEGKQLIKEYIPDVLIGLEFLWGGQVQLETTEIIRQRPTSPDQKPTFRYQRVLWTSKNRKVTKTNL